MIAGTRGSIGKLAKETLERAGYVVVPPNG